jgi:cellulose synthase/poly-beta-1,6-N-acetylglucosamine synthase-like glycosyltransferase
MEASIATLCLCFFSAFAISLPFIANLAVYRFARSKSIHFVKDEAYAPPISFIVATYNEEKRIVAKLDNLLEQNYPVEKIQMVVVDSSLDDTRASVRRWSTQHPSVNLVLLEEASRTGLAHALNLGYRAATGEILIKSDSDVLLDTNSARSLVANFADSRVGGVSGELCLVKRFKIQDGFHNLFYKKRIFDSRFGVAYPLDAFFGFRKSLFESINESSVADDAEIGIGILRKGYATILEPSARFFEETPTNIKKRLAQKQRRAQGQILVALQNRDMLFRRRYGFFGVVLFPMTFAMLIVNPWLIVVLMSSTFLALFLHFGPLGILLFAGLLAATILVYAVGTPQQVAGFIEAQLALIIGWLHLIVGEREYVWAKSSD